MRRQLPAIAAMLITASSAQAQQLLQPPTQGVISNPDIAGQTEDLRVRSEGHDRMTVPVRVSGAGPYYFLVDTGADRTAISRELANHLKLLPGAKTELHSVTGTSMISTALLSDLQLTDKPIRIDDAALLEAANIGADGILGIDSLQSKRVVFNFQSNIMSIVPSTAEEPTDETNAIVVQARRRNGRLIISEAKAQGRSITVVLDTGAQVTIGNEALRRELGVGQRLGLGGKLQLQSVTGAKIEGDYVYVPQVVIGEVTLKNLVVVFTRSEAFQQLNLDRKPALLLGMNALRAFNKVSIDFANRKFRMVVPVHSELEVNLARL